VHLHAERADDMAAGGGRASMDASWSASVQPGGTISSLELALVFDGGCADGAAGAGDLGMAIHWSDNCYAHADFSCSGKVVQSAKVGTTACRAPGVIQSICLHELVVEAVAEAVGLPAETVRERNMYAIGDTTPFGLKLGSAGVNWVVPQLWAACKAEWAVEARRLEIDALNAGSAFRKRGL
jgi:xanthine dehydrogenase molybdopterin-binding subunit B